MNREDNIEYSRERDRRTRERLHRIKAVLGCVKCGEDDPRCLDFHHVDPDSKSHSVSQMGTYKWKSVLEEIKKCDVLCANCHRKLRGE